jgi:hypothetical protein
MPSPLKFLFFRRRAQRAQAAGVFERIRPFNPDFSWLDSAPGEPSPDTNRPHDLKSDPEATATGAQSEELPAREFPSCYDVNLEFLTVDGLLENTASANKQSPHFDIATLSKSSPNRPRSAKPFTRSKRRKQRELSFLGNVLFFGSSAIVGITIALVVVKVTGTDPFGLARFFSFFSPH